MGRNTAVAAKAAPEQIGTLTSITSPFWWIIVVVLITIGVALAVWSVFGQVYVTVSGLGMVVPASGHITSVPSKVGGVVSKMVVKQDDEVEEGALLAEIGQPRLKIQMDSAQALVDTLRAQRERLARQTEAYVASRDASARGQIAALQAKIASLRDNDSFHAKVLADMEDELKRGFVTRTQVEQARGDKITTELNLRDAQSQIQTIKIQMEEDRANAERQLFTADQDILKAVQQVEDLKLSLAQAQRITAPIAGRIASVATAEGKMLGEGAPVVTMEPQFKGIRVAAYFQIADGKQIQLGAKANVKIGSVDSDVYGTAKGHVVFVADLASTTESLKNTLENATLVQQIERVGAPLKVLIELRDAPNAPGFVMMSSGRPSPVKVSVGTTATAQVIVERAAPISYVIKLFH